MELSTYSTTNISHGDINRITDWDITIYLIGTQLYEAHAVW